MLGQKSAISGARQVAQKFLTALGDSWHCKSLFVANWFVFEAEAGLWRNQNGAPCANVANRSSATSGDDDYRAYYTPELVELVYQRYRDDVELLGYGDAYRSLRKVVQDDAGGAA